MMVDDGLTPEDVQALAAIHRAAVENDPRALPRLLMLYYRDPARADRTPRRLLYFHLGLLIGALARAHEG